MYKFLSSIARPRALLITAAAFLGMLVVMQVLSARIAGLPDMFFSYTPGRLISALDTYGEAGRTALMRLHAADMLFALSYGALYALVLVYLWGVRGGAARTALLLAAASAVAALMDCSENVCIQIVSAHFSRGASLADIAASPPFAATLAGIATPVKWGFNAICVLAMLAGVAFAMARRGRASAAGASK